MESGVLSPPLLYDFYQSISIFSADSSISTGSGCECRAFEIAVDPHLTALAKKAAAQSGDLARRGRGGSVAVLRTFTPCLLQKSNFIPSSQRALKCFRLKFRCAALEARHQRAVPPSCPATVVAVSPSGLIQDSLLFPHSWSPLRWPCQGGS